jgi:hypothetical protein
MVAGQQHKVPLSTSYAKRISNLLQIGIPTACATYKPKDEPHLQQLCDSILKSHEEKLTREYPFLRWSSSLTKPDWSSDEIYNLWVELKYVRKKTDIRNITEEIAADITKYSDNGKNTLFVVYDPLHLISDDKIFSKEITSRENLFVSFVR